MAMVTHDEGEGRVWLSINGRRVVGFFPYETPETAAALRELPLTGTKGPDLRAALRPFVAAYMKAADEIGDSDLYDEQPRHVTVTLGDCRRARAALAAAGGEA